MIERHIIFKNCHSFLSHRLEISRMLPIRQSHVDDNIHPRTIWLSPNIRSSCQALILTNFQNMLRKVDKVIEEILLLLVPSDMSRVANSLGNPGELQTFTEVSDLKNSPTFCDLKWTMVTPVNLLRHESSALDKIKVSKMVIPKCSKL